MQAEAVEDGPSVQKCRSAVLETPAFHERQHPCFEDALASSGSVLAVIAPESPVLRCHRIGCGGFGRSERAMSDRQYGGLGIGLYVARRIVDAHGGTVVAASRPGSGIRIELPLSPEPPRERT